MPDRAPLHQALDEVRAIDVADSDYEDWRKRVHDAAEGVCARVI